MFWKIYSWIFISLLIIALFFFVDDSSENALILFFDFFALIGVLSYAYKKTVFNKWFWRLFFIAYLIESIVLEIIPSFHELETAYGWITIIFGFIIAVPAYLALYLYSFKYLKE